MKKLISLALVLCVVFSCLTVYASAYGWTDPDILTVDEAVEEHEFIYGEEVPTNRYYFLMPTGSNGDLGDDDSVDPETGEPVGNPGKYAKTWYIPMADGTLSTQTAGIYWWESEVADPAAWVGYLPSGEDEADPNVYYADVPQAVTTIVWNNAVDGGLDETDPIYFCAAQSINIPCEYYDPGESDNYPDGTDSFDNMIFVIDPDLISEAELSGKQTCGGEWYYYYGNGCYGFTKDGSEADCLRDDHFDANGNHVVPKAEKPTEAPVVPTEAPEVPTEAPEVPTEAPEVPTEAPVVPTEAPEVPTEAPEVPTEAPEVPTEAPVVPTEAPEVPTEAPEVPTEAPEVPTEAPEVPTEAPEVPTKPPVVPTEAPEVPTEAPEVPTKPPVVPTEAPEVPTQPPVVPTQPPVVPEYDLGDVNGDGVIDVMDATRIQMHVAKLLPLTGASINAADTTKDGLVDVMDATKIQQFIAKLITKF